MFHIILFNMEVKLNTVQEVDQSWSLLDIVNKCRPVGWSDVFDEAVNELEELDEDLKKREVTFGRYYPDKKNLFRAFHLTPLDSVRVVIFGQDPYPDRDRSSGEIKAQGLSFSVNKSCAIPPSLRNIYKEIKSNYDDFTIPSHGDLSTWANQGVLLLNACLTVDAGSEGTTVKIWDGFLYRVIEAILKTNPKCIFVLWGRNAQTLKKIIKNRGIVLEAPHPSSRNIKGGFLGCKHFIRINELLMENNKNPINWNL